MKSTALIFAAVCTFALPAGAETKSSFSIVDTDADRLVSQFEFIRFLTSATGIASTDALVHFVEIDTNRSRTVSEQEWDTACQEDPWIRRVSVYAENRENPRPQQAENRWMARITK